MACYASTVYVRLLGTVIIPMEVFLTD